jgi:leucyl aminopeptidase
LTGGCSVAFGDVTSAVMGNDRRLIDSLIATGEECGEHLWQLPLFEEYGERIKSDVADVKNSGGREASPITAGMFLKLFVDKSRWIHVDMAGKEITDREGHTQPRGGTGFGTRTLFEFCRRIA